MQIVVWCQTPVRTALLVRTGEDISGERLDFPLRTACTDRRTSHRAPPPKGPTTFHSKNKLPTLELLGSKLHPNHHILLRQLMWSGWEKRHGFANMTEFYFILE